MMEALTDNQSFGRFIFYKMIIIDICISIRYICISNKDICISKTVI